MEGYQIGNNTLDMSVLGDTHSNLKAEQWEPVTGILSQEITLIIACQLTRLGVAENLKVRKSAQKQGVTHNQTTTIIDQNA